MAKAEHVKKMVENESEIIGDRSCGALKATVGTLTFKPDEVKTFGRL